MKTDDAGMRTYIDVSFEEKDEAKDLGARWDRLERRWFIPPHIPEDNFGEFSRWFSEDIWWGSPTCPKEDDPLVWGKALFKELQTWAEDRKLGPSSLQYWDVKSVTPPLEYWKDSPSVVQIVWPRGPYCWAVKLLGQRFYDDWKPLIGSRRYFPVPGHYWSFSVQYVDLSNYPEEIRRIKAEKGRTHRT